MRFLVLNNENGLGTAKELIINWESVKYIRPFSSDVFFMELNNGSSIKLTVNAGNSSVVIDAINTAVKSRSNSNRVIPIQQKSIGAFSFTSIEYLEGGGFIDGRVNVYVSGNGTETENGQALLDGYQEAVAKIPQSSSIIQQNSLGVFGRVDNVYDVFLGGVGIGSAIFKLQTPYNFVIDLQNGAGALNYTFEVLSNSSQQRFFQKITLNGAPVTDASYTNLPVPVLIINQLPTMLIVGPGTYNLPSDLVIDNIVSMVSLLGTKSTIIKGANVKIEAGANNSITPNIYKGFLVNSQWYVASNLSSVTFEDIWVSGTTGNFQPQTGVGTASSTYKNCYGSESFATGSGASCSGTFIESWGYKSFGFNGANVSGQFYRCGYDNSNTGTASSSPYRNGEYQFGNKCNEFSGSCINCVGDFGSFASNTDSGSIISITSNAQFINCVSLGTESFAVRANQNSGSFVNCKSGSNSFSYNVPFNGDHSNAEYINCVGTGSRVFGAPSSSSPAGSFTGRCINCTALSVFNFGKDTNSNSATTALLYNCYSNDGFAAVSGSGKIRNSLDNSTFSIINLG